MLATAILGSAMAFVDATAVNVALPAIENDLGTALAAMQWVANSYTLLLAAALLIGGAAGDRFGRRFILCLGIGIFTVASIACGLAPGISALIAARAVQGLGGAFLIPSTLALIGASFPAAERGKAIGTWAAFSAITTAIGPVLGGWLVDAVSWRAIFFINVPIALATLWIAGRHVPESHDPHATAALDWRGALLALLGLASFVFGLIAGGDLGWLHPAVLGSLAAGVILLAVFLYVEKTGKAPMMPLDLFRSRNFSGVNLVTLLLYAALGGAFFFLPFDLIQAHGYSATRAGAAFLPFTVIMGGLSRWSGGLLDRFGARAPLILGPITAAIGFALLALPGAAGSYWTTFFPAMVVLALGMAISVAPLTTAVMNAVPDDAVGIASGINNAAARLAGLLAVTILGIVALSVFDSTLDRHASDPTATPALRAALSEHHGSFTAAALPATLQGAERKHAEEALADAVVQSVRVTLLAAAALALAGAASAAAIITPQTPRSAAATRPAAS